MTTNLSELVPSLKRDLAAPGEFDNIFPNSDNNTLVGQLADGFCDAQLDGWFGGVTLDLTTNLLTPTLSLPGRALIVFYTSSRVIQAQLRNLNSMVRYKAGSVEYETQQASSVLKAELDRITARKQELKTLASRSAGTTTTVFDAYFARATQLWAIPAADAAMNVALSLYPYEAWSN